MASFPYVNVDQVYPPLFLEPSDDPWFNGWFGAKGTTLILTTPRTPDPEVGYQGEICWNTSGLQTCVSANTWKLASFDDSAASLTNKTIVGSTNTVHADGIKSASGTVVTSAASAPAAGQVLTATDGTTAVWSPISIPSMFFGNSANDVVYSTNTTLTSDVYARNITVNPGVIVSGPYRIFANGTLTLGAGSNINANGFSASGATGGAALTAGSLGGGSAGGAGGLLGLAGANGGAAPAQTQVGLGPQGGSGGAGNALLAAPGAGGTASIVTAANGGPIPVNDLTCALRGRDTNNIKLTGGSGGGGGGGGALVTGGSGGGGGGGAGVIMVCANVISGSGTITATGGAGGIGSSSGLGNRAGGGGGGGGGLVIVVKNVFAGGFTAAQITAAGGLGGASGGTGGNPGVDGAAGNVILF